MSAAHTVKTGDIFYSRWGYDQTNIDFYQVVRTTAHYIYLHEIAATRNAARELLPIPDLFFQEPPKRYKVFTYSGGPSVSLTSYSSAWLWDGSPLADTYTHGGVGH